MGRCAGGRGTPASGWPVLTAPLPYSCLPSLDRAKRLSHALLTIDHRVEIEE